MRRFVKNKTASVLILVGFTFVMLAGTTGMAIDYARGLMLRSELRSALDAAALAGGTSVNSTTRDALIQKYFTANLPANFMGATISPLSITLDSTKKILTVSATASLPYSLFSVVNNGKIAASANTQVTITTTGMELVLVMDNTGSMTASAGSSISKIQAAKNAANNLLTILYGPTANTADNLWVGVVPFSDAVNIGTSRTNWVDSTSFNFGTTSWYGCVEARANGSASPVYDISDDPPSVKLFRKFYSPCNSYDTNSGSTYDPINAWYGTNSNHDNCSTGGGLGYKSGLNTSDLGPNLYCPQPVQPMVAEKSIVATSINSMQAVGNTHINLGLAWGWRMLSPRWRGLWGGEMNTNNLPLAYNTPLMQKAIILMTDGDNTLTGANVSYTAPAVPSIYTAYGYTTANQLAVSGGECNSSANCAAGQTALDNRTTSVCTQMKAQGIIIYTIALGTGVSTTGQNILKNCASNPAYYFLSPTTDDLQKDFAEIGDSLNNLRISQ